MLLHFLLPAELTPESLDGVKLELFVAQESERVTPSCENRARLERRLGSPYPMPPIHLNALLRPAQGTRRHADHLATRAAYSS